MLAEEIKEDNFAIKGCWEVLVSSTALDVGLGSWMESPAGIVTFHPILIGVHVEEAVVVVLGVRLVRALVIVVLSDTRV